MLAALLCVLSVVNARLGHYVLSPEGNSGSRALDMAGFHDVRPSFANGTLVEVWAEWGSHNVFERMGYQVVESTKGHPLSAAPPSGYNTPEELHALFVAIADDNEFAELIDITEELDTPATHEGRHIFALKLSDNVAEDEDEPNLLLVSNHHARELITPQLALDTARRMVAGYSSGDEDIMNIIDDNQVYIMWTMNPDGLAYVWSTDNMWRKNRKPNTGGSFGVDLNRNYDFGWDFSCGGSTNPTSATYRGVSPSSEEETQTMNAFHKDRRFALVLDFHSFARDARPNYAACATLPTTLQSYFNTVATTYAQQMNYVLQTSCCTGGQIGGAYSSYGSHSVLAETGTQFQPPGETMEAELVRVWPGTKWYFSMSIPISGHVYNEDGEGVEARFDLPDFDFRYEESWTSHPASGRYHLWLPNGDIRIGVTAEGYVEKRITVHVVDGGVEQDIILQSA